MRFYDPEFGTVLIDGVDIKTMDVRSLRTKLGLVMQEPTLFNYNLLENILYGNLNASNSQVEEAAQIANALEFIQSKEISQAFADDPKALLEAWDSHFEAEMKSLISVKRDDDIMKKIRAKAALDGVSLSADD